MLASALLSLAAAAAAVAAPAPIDERAAALNRFQWPFEGSPYGGWLSVSISRMDQNWTSYIDNGTPVYACVPRPRPRPVPPLTPPSSGTYLRYVQTQWEHGNGVFRIQGTYNKCLDAGLSASCCCIRLVCPVAHAPAPGNGTPLKVWDCYPGVMQQNFRWRNNQIELVGKSMSARWRAADPQTCVST